MSAAGQHFKIKLSSGRILGPLDLERVRLFMIQGQIRGDEQAREYPKGEWMAFHRIPLLAQLVVMKAEGKLRGTLPSGEADPSFAPEILAGATKVLTLSANLEPLPEIHSAVDIMPEKDPPPEPEPVVELERPPQDEEDKTVMAHTGELEADRTQMGTEKPENEENSKLPADLELDLGSRVLQPLERNISKEQTVMFQRSRGPGLPGAAAERKGWKKHLRIVLIVGVLLFGAMEVFFPEKEQGAALQLERVRPKLPVLATPEPDPRLSSLAYDAAIKDYLEDTVVGYRGAVQQFHKALAYDVSNVKALALLASSYLNLIDSSNKDENYFNVISELIKMSRAKSVDLPETVIADVEFYVTTNKPEAAQDRIVEYTKTHQSFGLEMFYYLGLAFYHRGDAASAANYLNQFPDQKIYSSKIYYLRGRVAEALGDQDAALREYQKAIEKNMRHAKSRLRIADIFHSRGNLKAAGNHLEILVTHPTLLDPRDLARAFYLHSVLAESFQKLDVAIADIEKAVKLDPGNHDYSLQLYILRATAGGSVKQFQKEARMYYFLSEGERFVKQGRYNEALLKFLEARGVNDASPLPLVKMGDMAKLLNDFTNARINYKLAADRAKNSIEVWSKYIDILIQSYEWEEAQKAMDRFRKLPVPQSAIDKAAADIYAKQGKFVEALMYYKKAMARETVDTGVYIAYADTLRATKSPELVKQAPFFYALALRFDPLNFNAILGTAKTVATLESIDRAVTLLQDELQKRSAAKAELLTAIAEFQVQKGDWAKAQESIDQAMQINPEYGPPWKIQAQIYRETVRPEKMAIEKALQAYRSYADRSPSDAAGYIEMYRLYANSKEYEKASEVLSKIYAIYPKYPTLHHYKGALYSVMGNHKIAIQEFLSELANTPGSVPTMIALGQEYIEVGAYNDALTQFNRAMQQAPQNAEAKHLSAYANYLLKNFQGATALYNAALALDPANPTIYKRLGMAYRAMGDHSSAGVAFRKYLEMEPDAPDRDLFEKYR